MTTWERVGCVAAWGSCLAFWALVIWVAWRVVT